MRRVAERDTPENRRALFELLLAATLLAATPGASAADTERGLATITGEDGPSLPVFTRIEALLAWRPAGYDPVALTGRTLFETAARYKTAKIEVNPASAPRGWISRTEIEALAEGRVPLGPSEPLAASKQPTSADEIAVTRPADPPPAAVVEAARRALDAQPDASAGWLFATAQGDEPSQLMVGVELARGLDRARVEATMQAIVEETWARSADAGLLRFMLVAQPELRDSLARGAGELIFKR
jgi:SseB protein N-terminal domain